jgi:hypothetical protein
MDRISFPFLLRYNPQVTIPQFRCSMGTVNQNNVNTTDQTALPSKHSLSASAIKSHVFQYNPHCEWRLNLAVRLLDKLKSKFSHIECAFVTGQIIFFVFGNENFLHIIFFEQVMQLLVLPTSSLQLTSFSCFRPLNSLQRKIMK